MLHHLKEQCYHLKHSYESTSLPNIEHDDSPLTSKVESERDFNTFPEAKFYKKFITPPCIRDYFPFLLSFH